MGNEVGPAPSAEPLGWREAGELADAGPPPWAAQVGKGACVRGAARELGGRGRRGGAGGRSAVGSGQRRGPGGRAHFADLLHHPQATGPSLPRAITRTRRPPAAPPPARLGAEPSGGAGIPPGSPPTPPLPGARFLPLPARPPPGRQPTACPRGRQEATCPRKECRAWRAGGGRWAGPGRGGRERPTAKVGESEGASPRPPRPPAPPLRPARARPGLIATHHTFPADTRTGRPAGSGAAAGQVGPAGAAPAPLRAPPVLAGSEEGAGRPVSPHPSLPPRALGPRWGAGG